MKTREEYFKSINKMKPEVYMLGEKIEPPILDHPQIRACAEVLATTFDGPKDPAMADLATATSHLTGEKINRFCHINRSTDDLCKKMIMIRNYCRKGLPCILRCMGCDSINSLSITTYDIDQKYNTGYHARFLEYLKYFQKEDLVAAAAMTDVKGDRNLRPHQQADPDMHLHVVERREDGIVVRGAKHHTSAAPVSNELIVLPTRDMQEKDKDYAVAFAIPADAPGIIHICRPTARMAKKEIESPLSTRWGSIEPLVVFDDVFVPWERVFMCGEWEFAYPLVEGFATFHRHSYAGCKPATSDQLVGAASLIAEYNGVDRASHIREKIAELICEGEIAYSCGIAGSYFGQKAPSGTYYPDVVLVNVGKHHSGTHMHEEYRRVHDIAGGIACDIPSEADYRHPVTGKWVEKYMKGKADVPTEHRMRIAHFIEDLTGYPWGSLWLVASVHGGGSPAAEVITLLRAYDIEARRNQVKKLAGIPTPEK